MAKVVAVAGLGDEAPSAAPSGGTMLAWGIVFGTTIGIFIGTLMLNPSKKRGR
jgi:hypothetical protein